VGAAESADWLAHTISPVVNPVLFESPFIDSEVRPIFMTQKMPGNFITGGGNLRVYAVQLRYALTDRLALIATKDGFIEFNPSKMQHQDGWANLAGGLKYAIVDDRENDFILTPGVTFEFPTGNQRVFQGEGSGIWNLFVSAGKGFGDFHLTGNLGFEIPFDFSANTSQLHYSLQADYYTCQYFIPFVAVNGYTVMSEGDALPLGTEGYDLINFGSSNAQGWNGVVLGAGFRSRLVKWADLGFGYEYAVANPKGIFSSRFTVDFIVRF
jgi:hypothetical protein